MSTLVIDGTDDTARPILVDASCPRLPRLSIADREGLAAAHRAGPLPPNTLPSLRRVELRQPAAPADPPERLRVCFWNVERGRDPRAAARLLREAGAGASLLCELDHGMARTRQVHVAAEIAAASGQGYAFGVEFVELGPGNLREAAAHAGSHNAQGYHGNAVLSGLHLGAPVMVRLPGDGGWFTGRRQERRIGSRIAILATVALAGGPVVLVSTHLESHAGPAVRAAQMTALLRAIERRAPGLPVLIGGDLNTRTDTKDAVRGRSLRERLHAADPGRFTDPAPHEPLFAAAAAAGFQWATCNTAVPTERPGRAGLDAPRFRLDWFLARGLVCSRPAVIPALDPGGAALSDHDAIAVDIALP